MGFISTSKYVLIDWYCFEIISNCILVKIKLDGHELPNILPEHLIPPSKRHLAANSSPSGGNASLYPAIDGGSGEQNSTDDSWFLWFFQLVDIKHEYWFKIFHKTTVNTLEYNTKKNTIIYLYLIYSFYLAFFSFY